MRVVLATSLGGAGHLEPVAAVGRSLAAVGHDVTLLVPPSLERAAREGDLPVEVGGEPPTATVDAYRDRLASGEAAEDPGLIDRELFADHATRAMLAAADALLARVRPSLVLRESTEYASAIAARHAGIPFGTIAISLSRIEHGVLSMVAPVLDRLGAGVAGAIARAPFLARFPARLDPSPWTTTVRYRELRDAPAPLPAWWGGRGGPLVYLTFGSVVGHTGIAEHVFPAVLASFEDEPVRVLLTVGRRFDPDDLGVVPDNVHVERWVPQASVFAECDLVVCHGGSGTTFGALAAGVPLVVCPLFADNARNGAALVDAGAGLVVALDATAPGSGFAAAVRAAVDEVLEEPSYRSAARAVGDEMAGYPLPDAAVEAIHWSPTT